MPEKTLERNIILFLWLNIALSFLFSKGYDIFFIFGIVSLAIISITLYVKKDITLILLVSALLLSTFGLIKFSSIFVSYVGLFKTKLIHFPPLMLLLFLIYKRRHELLDLRNQWTTAGPDEFELRQANKIAFFKREFENIPSSELIRKLDNDPLVEEAKAAIQQILSEKDTTADTIL